MPSKNNTRKTMSHSETTEYLCEMREHANPDVREFFADKVSEEEACQILKCALNTLRSNRSRGIWKLNTTHVNRQPVLFSHEVVAVLQREKKRHIPRSEI